MLKIYDKKAIAPLKPLIPVKAFLSNGTTPAAYQLAYRIINLTTGEFSEISPKSSFFLATCPNTAFAPTVVRFPPNAAVERAVRDNPTNPEVLYQIILYVAGVPYIYTGGVGNVAGPLFTVAIGANDLNPINAAVFEPLPLPPAVPPNPDRLNLNLGLLDCDKRSVFTVDVETTNEMAGVEINLSDIGAERFNGVLTVSVVGVHTNTTEESGSYLTSNNSVTIDCPQRSSNYLPLSLGPGSVFTLQLSLSPKETLQVVEPEDSYFFFGNFRANVGLHAVAKSYPVEPGVDVPLSFKIMGNAPLDTFYTGIYTVNGEVATLNRDLHVNTQGRCIVLPKGYRFKHAYTSNYLLTVGIDGDIRQRDTTNTPIFGLEEVIYDSASGWTIPAYAGKLVAIYGGNGWSPGGSVYLHPDGSYDYNQGVGGVLVGIALSDWLPPSATMVVDGLVTAAASVSAPNVICAAAGTSFAGGGGFNFVKI